MIERQAAGAGKMVIGIWPLQASHLPTHARNGHGTAAALAAITRGITYLPPVNPQQLTFLQAPPRQSHMVTADGSAYKLRKRLAL